MEAGMKRIALVVLLLAVVGFASAQETQKVEKQKMPACVLTRPLATLVGGVLGQLDIIVEVEAAPLKNLILTYMPEFLWSDTRNDVAMNFGAAYNFMGTYLTGLYLGAYPGFTYVTENHYPFALNLYFETGYQHVFQNKLVLNGYLGYLWRENNPGIKAGFKIGLAN